MWPAWKKVINNVLLLSVLCLCVHVSAAQQSLRLCIKQADKNMPLAGASIHIPTLRKMFIADSTGCIVLNSISSGTYKIDVSYIGFEEKSIQIEILPGAVVTTEVVLEENEEEEEEVVITATRISRSIANQPTRTEVISGEELEEKGNMKPGDIRMMLNESTGIQTQQTSATSFNAGIRIQGLEGRYTQMLRDGYPIYGGFAGSLSILQIAPLDLKQVEVIKGAASTLYGGGAIAGLVNLVSKTPGTERSLNFLANATSAGGYDLSGFYSERFGKAGVTLFASRNSNSAFDPANIGFTAIPKFERYTINPRLFLYGKKTTIDAGVSYISENRIGGSINYIKNDGPGFFEKNNTGRFTAQLGMVHTINDVSTLRFKNSYNYFDRIITIPEYDFSAVQRSSFSELSYQKKGEQSEWVLGANFTTDHLQERTQTLSAKRDYQINTWGLFVQNIFTITDRIILESGLRADHVSQFGFELLPKIAAMFKVSSQFTTRLGGGFGYKPPTIFTEEAERRQFKHIFPINTNTTQNERSAGINWDINYKTSIGDLDVQLNQLFFYTRLFRPLTLMYMPGNRLDFQNADGYLDTKGWETNLRLVYGDLKLFIGYTFTDANTHFNNVKALLPLTARHRLNNVLMYEIEEKWKLGLEAYYFSKQQLNDGSFGQPYWITGFMAEKLWERLSLFINFENFTNTRQTRFGPLYSGSTIQPVFQDIYAPVDGFVVNGGIKIKI